MNNKPNKCYCTNIPQQVKVRKHDVDIIALQDVLREHKKIKNLSCKVISDILKKPKTLVEHWFRTDNCFAIPDEDVWFELKRLLNIQTDVFDKSIMEFEYKLGAYEKSERCYWDYGIAPTITCSDDIKIIVTNKF